MRKSTELTESRQIEALHQHNPLEIIATNTTKHNKYYNNNPSDLNNKINMRNANIIKGAETQYK